MKQRKIIHKIINPIIFFTAITLIGCTPRIEVAVPDKPIEINLNIKIDHEVRVKIDKELDSIISKDSALF